MWCCLCQNQQFLIWYWNYSCEREKMSFNADCMRGRDAEVMDLQPKFQWGRKSLYWEKTNAVLIAALIRFGTCWNTEMRANNKNMHLQPLCRCQMVFRAGTDWLWSKSCWNKGVFLMMLVDCGLGLWWVTEEGQILCLPSALSSGGAGLAGSVVWRLHLRALFYSWFSTPDPLACG